MGADTKLELADAQSIEDGYSEEAENAVANLVAEYEARLAAMEAENARLKAELDQQQQQHERELATLRTVAAEKAQVSDEMQELRNKLEAEEQSKKGLESQAAHLKTLLLTMKERLESLAKKERE